MYSRFLLATVAALAFFSHSLALEAEAGWRHRRCRPCPPRTMCQARPIATPAYTPAYSRPYTPTYTPSPAVPAPSFGARDPNGFLAWINAVRARSGLGAVAWSDDLAADASINSSTGFGHHYMGRARRQNVGVGGLGAVQSAWLASPAHASALLDPSVSAVALSGVGNVWTYSAR